ncbi:MAG TPA: RIO1 family regulatory kinase/ATPase [Dehalococcoidia bacterium]|nr:RIO1 family regulatory kinase/ATPase [Dehalococcoidia bacterium]
MTHDYEALAEGGHVGGLGMQRRSQGRDHVQQLDSFYDQGLISEVLYLVSIGKEASVYCCAAGRFLAADMSRRLHGWQGGAALQQSGSPAVQQEAEEAGSGSPAVAPGRPAGEPAGLVAAKVFRARQYRFKNDAVYQEERTRGMKGQAKRALAKKTRFGREVQTGAWVHHEYEVLKELHDAGCDVPRPLAAAGDAILLEFVGDEEGPAPQLQRVALNREDAEEQFERTMRNVEIALSLNRIHGDLSAHNILWWGGRVVLIDFPQAVDARFNSQAQQLLERDIANVVRYFSQFGVRAEAWRLSRDLWRRYMRAEL